MYKELYQYLVQHKQLAVPGIGTFLLERKPAEADFPARIINPPAYHIALQLTVNSSSKNLFSWLASALDISDRDAVIRFNDFAFDLKQKLSAGCVIKWAGIGTLSKGLAGEIKFASTDNAPVFEQPVTAQKVIRKSAEHTVRVGEQEKTSTQMTELLNKSTQKRSYWWAYALIVGLLAMIFIFWYFSEYGLNIASTGNGKKLNAQKPAATYKILP
jgi:nucleoid DNA-binding protein